MLARAMQARYEAAGYRLPQVVFWNLAASGIFGQKSTPVQFNEQGVALVSGFSGQLLKLFMDKPGNMEAWKVNPHVDGKWCRPWCGCRGGGSSPCQNLCMSTWCTFVHAMGIAYVKNQA